METPDLETVGKSVIDLAQLTFALSTINRATYVDYPDMPESDTDHTVMVGLIACAVAATYVPQLDVGKVAQFALVHDVVEAYASDTNTFGGLSDAQKADKEQREAEALARIQTEFGATLPWLTTTIVEYETLESPEARFIKTLDKILPKIARILNYAKSGKTYATKEEIVAHCNSQLAQIRATYGKDQEFAVALYEYAAHELIETYGKTTN